MHVNHQVGERNEVIPSAQCFLEQRILTAESCIARKERGGGFKMLSILIYVADTQPKVDEPYLVEALGAVLGVAYHNIIQLDVIMNITDLMD